MGRLFRIYRNLVYLLALLNRAGGGVGGVGLMKKNLGENRMKTFYSKVWGNIV